MVTQGVLQHFIVHGWINKKDFEVELILIYDPEIPPERVGQATILEASAFSYGLPLVFNWYDN